MKEASPSYLIRQALAWDEEPLLEIVRGLQAPSFYWPDDMFRAELVQTKTWVMEHQGKLVAFVCVRDVTEAYELSVLATSLAYQGKGLMKKLLQLLMGDIEGERHLWLEVHENNLTARNLYEKLGFVQTGTRNNYYRDGSTALLYTRFHY